MLLWFGGATWPLGNREFESRRPQDPRHAPIQTLSNIEKHRQNARHSQTIRENMRKHAVNNKFRLSVGHSPLFNDKWRKHTVKPKSTQNVKHSKTMKGTPNQPRATTNHRNRNMHCGQMFKETRKQRIDSLTIHALSIEATAGISRQTSFCLAGFVSQVMIWFLCSFCFISGVFGPPSNSVIWGLGF